MTPAASLTAFLLVTLALSGCSAAPMATLSAVKPAPAASKPSTEAAAQPQAVSAAPTQPAATAKPVTGAPQGIAVGEPAPGGRMMGATALLTPCRSEFMTIDANGDGWIDAGEWAHERGSTDSAKAGFKTRDADGSGQLDNGEYGCQDTAPNGGAPDATR